MNKDSKEMQMLMYDADFNVKQSFGDKII